MINRNITKKDIKVYILILFVLFLGYSESLFQSLFSSSLVSSPYIGPFIKIFKPIWFLASVVPAKISLVIGFFILLMYVPGRFFNHGWISILIFWSTILIIGYTFNVKVTDDGIYLFPITLIVALPQVINTLIFVIYNSIASIINKVSEASKERSF